MILLRLIATRNCHEKFVDFQITFYAIKYDLSLYRNVYIYVLAD